MNPTIKFVCFWYPHHSMISYWLANKLKPQSSCLWSLRERRNFDFSELIFSFQLLFSSQTSFGILILLVLSKAFISPSVVSSDNLKRLWCIYLGSGLQRGWQIPHHAFGKCLLAARGFQAPWRGRRTRPRTWLPEGAPVGGAVVWLLTCKWSEGPEADTHRPSPPAIP